MCAHVNSVCRSASSVATCRVLVVGRRRQNSRPSVCFVSLGLLQFCHVRRSRRLDPAAPGCPERHRTTGDRNTEARPHQSSSQAAPVRQRVTFKLAVLVFKALHGLAPRYLADDCQLVTDTGCRHLRSSESTTCVLQRTNTRFDDRKFRVAAPSVWNSLPADLRHSDLSLGQLRRALKTFLFNRFCSA